MIAPLCIEKNEDASGGKIVVCQGIHISNSGIAKYRISVKKEGKYYFWGKCYWKDACSNQFRVQYNDTKYSCGDNPIYGRWHWVKGPSFHFTQGINEVYLVSHDEGARMDEILLTMDPEYVPFNKLREVYFLDFEDSLINKLTIKNKDKWHIINDETVSSICVLVSSEKNEEIALLDKADCKDDFIFQVNAKFLEPHSQLRILIDYINETNYRFISIDSTAVRYHHFNNNQENLLFEKNNVLLNNEFNSIALAKTKECLKLKIEGKTVLDLAINIEMEGKVGIGIANGRVLLDNIAYYFPLSFVQKDSFHDMVDYQFHEDRPEKVIKPFENMKAGHSDWWKLEGDWKRTREETEDIRGVIDTSNDSEKPAMLVFGNDFWKDYIFNVATKVKDDSGFGVCTYFQDSLNYYLFRWLHDQDGCYKRQLIKMEDGNEKILASDGEIFIPNTWYDIGMRIFKDKLTAIVNNQPVLTATDRTFREGRLGFWTNSSQNAHFDDVKITVLDSISEIGNSRDYIFYTGNGGALARSLCDWTPNSQKKLYFHKDNAGSTCYLSKEVFEDVILSNIDTLPEKFRMEVNTHKVPQDIDAVFEFTSQSEMKTVYKFIISNKEITLLKNGKMLISNDLNYDREKIEIYRQNNEWTIEFAGKKVFEYKDEVEKLPWNMSMGYSGIGKGQLFLNRIIIEDHF